MHWRSELPTPRKTAQPQEIKGGYGDDAFGSIGTVAGIDTDYLVVGAGAAGMAFTDALIADSDADVVMVDRRHRPGGHWNDAYPFVRLHGPSALYGVNSRILRSDSIDTAGPNAGSLPPPS
jgi:hypothetical protein